MSDNCGHNFGTFDDFGVKNDQQVSNNMILMSNAFYRIHCNVLHLLRHRCAHWKSYISCGRQQKTGKNGIFRKRNELSFGSYRL